MVTALIADDEPLARSYLRSLLEDLGVTVVGEAEDGLQALELAGTLKPQMLFLDIRMPGLDGLQTASAIVRAENPPLIVFVTGYSEHAATAFERDALDYVLKPVTLERLSRTVERAQRRLEDREARRSARKEILRQAAQSPRLNRLPVRRNDEIRLIRVQDILCAVAAEKRVLVRTAKEELPTGYTLKQLEVLLPADRFLRIHESALVRLDAVEAVLVLGDHTYEVRLTDRTRLPVSRGRYSELQRRLGLASAG